MRGWRKKRVKSDSESVLDNSRNDPFKNRAVDFKTGICIAFDQIRLKFAADVEIKPIKLKIMTLPFRIHELETSSD